MLFPAIPFFLVVGLLGVLGYASLTHQDRRSLQIAGGIVGIGGCVLSGIVFLVAAQRTYIFRGKAPDIAWTRYYVFGTKDVALESTTKTVTIGGESGTWIVNDTDAPLKVSRTTGAILAFDHASQETIAPGSAALSETGVDHIGPDDPLPDLFDAGPRDGQTLVHIGW